MEFKPKESQENQDEKAIGEREDFMKNGRKYILEESNNNEVLQKAFEAADEAESKGLFFYGPIDNFNPFGCRPEKQSLLWDIPEIQKEKMYDIKSIERIVRSLRDRMSEGVIAYISGQIPSKKGGKDWDKFLLKYPSVKEKELEQVLGFLKCFDYSYQRTKYSTSYEHLANAYRENKNRIKKFEKFVESYRLVNKDEKIETV